MISNLLLDTHAFIWLMEGDETLSKQSREIIKEASKENFIFVSAISFWEIAMLQSKRKLSLTLPLHQWSEQATSLPFLKVVDLKKEIAIESCKLPGDFHGDPADRMIIATARMLSAPLVTRDKKILDYAKNSFINIVKC